MTWHAHVPAAALHRPPTRRRLTCATRRRVNYCCCCAATCGRGGSASVAMGPPTSCSPASSLLSRAARSQADGTEWCSRGCCQARCGDWTTTRCSSSYRSSPRTMPIHPVHPLSFSSPSSSSYPTNCTIAAAPSSHVLRYAIDAPETIRVTVAASAVLSAQPTTASSPLLLGAVPGVATLGGALAARPEEGLLQSPLSTCPHAPFSPQPPAPPPSNDTYVPEPPCSFTLRVRLSADTWVGWLKVPRWPLLLILECSLGSVKKKAGLGGQGHR